MEKKNIEVLHDPDAGMFYVPVEPEAAYLSYIVKNGTILDLITTYVPISERGRGLAVLLVEAALQYAKKCSCQVIPTCPFVRSYLKKNTGYNDLVVNGPDAKMTGSSD